MKRLLTFLGVLLPLAMCMGVSCGQKEDALPGVQVDLRYRVADSYDLPAIGAAPFTIVVTSSDPWTVTSQHPDWCIIDEEDGKASDPAQVRVGKGDKTTIRVQYYNNTGLDDRVDYIEIRSKDWLGKRVTVRQKGIAYLTIPEDEIVMEVTKAGGDVPVHISANQDWSVAVTSGSWLSVKEGASGNGDGEAIFFAEDNPGEKRYAQAEIYDRHGDVMYVVDFTQDGVQLDPSSFELRAGFDQLSTSLDIIANCSWKAVKDNEADTWYTIEDPENSGDGTIHVTLTKNEGTTLRVGHIIITSTGGGPDDFVATKIITIKQAYEIKPVRVEFNNEEMSLWKSDWTNTPVYTKGVGTLFTSQARLNKGDKPFGTYTFRWSAVSPEARVRHWFCYSDGQEIKYNLVGANKNVVMDFNSSSAGVSGKPSGLSSYDVDITVPHELTIKFDPCGTEYCHVTFLVDGVEIGAFDSGDTVMHMVKWGSSINMYVGVDTGGSAVCEWYEYTEPTNWDE